LSRGGDQCVVSEYGADLRYFGGKTAAVETTSKVKVRSFADSFISLIKSSSSVFVMGHTEMDMDALGASLGVIAICDWCQKPCRLGLQFLKAAEKKTRQALIDAFPKETLDKLIIDPDDASCPNQGEHAFGCRCGYFQAEHGYGPQTSRQSFQGRRHRSPPEG
jgi:c-di-AMP phosphodiesterase-like protein